MEPKNHPFAKGSHFPNPHYCVQIVNFPGCTLSCCHCCCCCCCWFPFEIDGISPDSMQLFRDPHAIWGQSILFGYPDCISLKVWWLKPLVSVKVCYVGVNVLPILPILKYSEPYGFYQSFSIGFISMICILYIYIYIIYIELYWTGRS